MQFETNKNTLFERKKKLPIILGTTALTYLIVVVGIHLYIHLDFNYQTLFYNFIIVIAILFLGNIIFPPKTIISIQDNAVTVTSSGMVTANFQLDEITEAFYTETRFLNHIMVKTKDNLIFQIPATGFDKTEISQIINALESKKAS